MARRGPRTRPLHILLVPLGSAGDVHPFVAVGAALRQRGHLVTVITSPVFERLVRHVGLEFVPVGTAEDFDVLLQDPHLWEFRRGFEVVAKAVLTATPQIYQIISERYVAGETIVAAAGLAFGARIAQERLGVPLATIQLQPAAFQSVYQSPVLHPWLSRIDLLPRPLKRGVFRFTYFLADRIVGPETNRFRAALGLPPARRFLSDWWHSPRRVIGLFPEWFGPPQPDWPSQTRLTGFPLYDETGIEPVPSDLARFLSDAEDQGDRPIVFTPGSAMRHGRRFFEASVEACQHLGRRGLLLTRYPDQLPAPLPTQVRHFDYVPFSQLLPRCAALVHHGGVGTLAQGLAAGVPQLVMPMAHDQADNATRLQRLGAGRALRPTLYRGPAVARELAHLLSSPEVAASCAAAAAKVREREAVEGACDLIEQLSSSRG